jgi:hypothetical protein
MSSSAEERWISKCLDNLLSSDWHADPPKKTSGRQPPKRTAPTKTTKLIKSKNTAAKAVKTAKVVKAVAPKAKSELQRVRKEKREMANDTKKRIAEMVRAAVEQAKPKEEKVEPTGHESSEYEDDDE